MVFAVGMGEAIEEMGILEGLLNIDPVMLIEGAESRPVRDLERLIDDIAYAHLESAMFGADEARQIADHLVVASAFAGRLDELSAPHDVLMTAALLAVVVLQEHGWGQHA